MSKIKFVLYLKRKPTLGTKPSYKRKRYWLFALAAILATSCATPVEDSLADRSFLTEQPCTPTCWYTLELDKSSESDVYEVLGQLPFVDQATIKQTEFSWLGDPHAKEIYYGCTHPNKAKCGGARFSGDKLKLLYMSVGYELTFREVIEKLGLPDYVDYGPYHPESGGCQVELSWLDRGISIRSLDINSDRQCRNITQGTGIDPEIKVNAIFYSAKEIFGPEPADCCKRISWPGFAK